MSIETNRKLVLETWQALLRGDVKAAFANMSDDVTWVIPGMLPRISGVRRGKSEILEFLRSVSEVFPAGLETEIRYEHAAGDSVILELTNRGRTADGKPYENDYCFVYDIADGKVRAIREYVDTQRAYTTIVG